MFNYDLVHESSGNYDSNIYIPMPKHKKWCLADLVTEMSDFYKRHGANGGGSKLRVYRYDGEWDRYFYHPSKDCPLLTFHFAQGHSGLVETESLLDPKIAKLEVYCDRGCGFWGCDDWYAYLAAPPEPDSEDPLTSE